MKTILNQKAIENSVFGIDVSYTDMTGQPITPNLAYWSLTDVKGRVINGKYNQSLPLAETATIVLQDDDLAIYPGSGTSRFLLVSVEYDSTYGTDLTLKSECQFEIEPLVSYPTGM